MAGAVIELRQQFRQASTEWHAFLGCNTRDGSEQAQVARICDGPEDLKFCANDANLPGFLAISN